MLRVGCLLHYKRATDAGGYFPAYEMMLDDLRDYRFYAADMIHLYARSRKTISGNTLPDQYFSLN